MAHILTNAKEKATWNGTKFITNNSASSAAHTTIKTAIGRAYNRANTLTTAVSDGEIAWFRAQYVDQQYLTHYAIFQGTYADADDSITPVSGQIVGSSSGTSMPTFDQDADVLFIYGATPSEAHNPADLRVLSTGVRRSSGEVADTSSATLVNAADAWTIQQTVDGSKLMVTFSANMKSLLDGTSSQNSQGRAGLAYIDDVAATNDLYDHIFGLFQGATDTNSGSNSDVSILYEITDAMKVSDTAWSLRPRMRRVDANTLVTLIAAELIYTEVI